MDNNQLYNKWYNFFANFTVTSSLSIASNAAKNIQVPEDDNERAIAQKAATDYINWYNTNKNEIYNSDAAKGIDYAHRGQAAQYRAQVAQNFIRKCSSYVKKRDKQINKDIKGLYKQGAGSYSQQDMTNMSGDIVGKVDAATKAANNAILYFKQGNQQELQNLTAQIKDQLNDPEYKTLFTYLYYKGVKYTDMTKEQKRQSTVANLQSKYETIMKDYNDAKAGVKNPAKSLGFDDQNLAADSFQYMQKQKQQK